MTSTWLDMAGPELERARRAWQQGNAGMSRVCSRRAAGMALKAWLAITPREAYGTSFMQHLRALADDDTVDAGAREAAHRLGAGQPPEAGWQIPVPTPLTPMIDAETIVSWVGSSAASRSLIVGT